MIGILLSTEGYSACAGGGRMGPSTRLAIQKGQPDGEIASGDQPVEAVVLALQI
jgi:hypothetical protein